MLLSLSETEINKLSRLSQDKQCVEGLKKLFLEALMGSQDTDENRAAAHIAINALPKLFTALANISPEDKISSGKQNMI